MVEERYNPVDGKDYLSIQHLARYVFALQYLRPGMRVLDIGCGSGYGSAMLSEHGCRVIGADYDAEALAFARRTWSGVQFRQANALDLPFETQSFDAVITFETIEHVKDGDRFLTEMRRVLKRGGVFICSTPNIVYTSHPSYHVREYYAEEFYLLIMKYFDFVEKFGQYICIYDRIKDICMWRIAPAMVRLLDKLRIKEVVKRMLSQRSGSCETAAVGSDVLFVENRVEKSCYKVMPLKGKFMLRIMLSISYKQ